MSTKGIVLAPPVDLLTSKVTLAARSDGSMDTDALPTPLGQDWHSAGCQLWPLASCQPSSLVPSQLHGMCSLLSSILIQMGQCLPPQFPLLPSSFQLGSEIPVWICLVPPRADLFLDFFFFFCSFLYLSFGLSPSPYTFHFRVLFNLLPILVISEQLHAGDLPPHQRLLLRLV